MHKLLGLLYFLMSIGVGAQPSGNKPVDGALDARVHKLSEELRCLVCQNQSLADSHADLAVDLKNQVREKMKQGASDAEVITFMTERYGDFVLYRPPVKLTTVLLWFGPALLLMGGLTALFVRLKRRTQGGSGAELSAEDRARVAALLGGGQDSR